jgi:hypothetical protein
MKLTRYVTVELSRPSPTQLGRWTYSASNGVEVTILSIFGAEDVTSADLPTSGGLRFMWPNRSKNARILMMATLEAGEPRINRDNLVMLNEEARLRAEAAIMEYGDLLAVTCGCRRVFRSPKPCLALEGSNESEQKLLRRSSGIAAPFPMRPRAIQLPELKPGSAGKIPVADRMDGLALLADALSEDGAVGQVHNFFRLFERAFAKGPGDCIEPILSFLKSSPSKLSWTHEEISDWFLRLRPEVTHADRRENYARAMDVEPYLARIEYVAYDVLLNKAVWRNVDSSRRNAVSLRAGIDSDNSTMRLQHANTTLVFPWIDPFGLFEVEFDLELTFTPHVITNMPGYTSDMNSSYLAHMDFVRDFE